MKSVWLKQSEQAGKSQRSGQTTDRREGRTDVQGLLGHFKDFGFHGAGGTGELCTLE